MCVCVCVCVCVYVHVDAFACVCVSVCVCVCVVCSIGFTTVFPILLSVVWTIVIKSLHVSIPHVMVINCG